MRVSTQVLRRYLPVPEQTAELVALMEDVGLEVKRVEEDPEAGTVLVLELLANRGDHHCYEGIAQEISGRIGGEVCRPEFMALRPGDSPIELSLETELCPVYTATLLVRDGESGELDADTLAPLTAAGIHSVSAPVDATNLSNLELGQPTHAFDADKIAGRIVVRLSRPGERAWPLFAEDKVELPEGTLVIADDDKILAIAGVIGCEDSKTTADTKRIILESAAFDPVSVRKAARALDIHTDSKARFERGCDASLPLVGAGRVAHLLSAAGWRIEGASGVVGDWVDPERQIICNIDIFNRFLDVSFEVEELRDRLSRYGFVVHGEGPELRVQVPPHRLWDVEHWQDIAEELAKSIGYNDTPTTLPDVDLGALPSPSEIAKQQVEEVLVGLGFYEILTDGFYGRGMREQLGISEGHPLWDHVETKNSLDRGYSLLKNQCLGQALELVSQNLRNHVSQLKAYEWTHTFHPDASAENGVCTERAVLWGMTVGSAQDNGWAGGDRPADPLFLKGLVEEIATARGLDLRLVGWPEDHPMSFGLHPTRRAAIALGDQVVGVLGEVHPDLLASFKIKRARPCYFEISKQDLAGPSTFPTYQAPPVHQPIVRSLAFGLVGQVEAAQVARVVEDQGPDYLSAVHITDLFETEEEGQAVRAVTYELVFDNTDGSRSADSVNDQLEALSSAVEETFASQGVRQRA